MNNSPEYYRPVLEALCAFVREGTIGNEGGGPTTDIQAALTVIGRRKGAPREAMELGVVVLVDLERVKIPKANLVGANLSFSKLNDADLSGARLYDANLSYAILVSADLSGGAILNRADLGHVSLYRADLIRPT
jgi:hypothetical protein